MEDDIDIEEHDLLDNPKIRDIFPDLSLVKTEVVDDDEAAQEPECQMEVDYAINIKQENTNFDENDAYEQSDNFEINCEFEQNDNESDNQQNGQSSVCEFEQIIPNNICEVQLIEQNEYNAGDNQQNGQRSVCEFGQIIPNNICEVQLIEEPESPESYEFEETEDNYDLQNNEYDFTNKIILGSKPSYDDLYQEALHSKATVLLENWSDRLTNSMCYCNECEILFPTVNTYDAHRSTSHSLLVALDIPRPNTARKSTAPISKYCNHCDKTFPNDTALIKHLYELLPLNQFKPTPEPVKVIAKNPYKCIKCFKYFATLNDGKEHKRLAHPTMTNVNIICKVVTKTEKVQTVIRSRETIDFKMLSANLVPQSVLFQCNICQINFVSCYSAMQHERKCTNNTDFAKCDICKKKIRAKDAICHENQHRFVLNENTKFKVYTLNKNMYEKVLLKCPKCVICYDERSFWIHNRICNGEHTSYSHCNICSIDITSARLTSHESKHMVQKYKKKDFIIVEFNQLNKNTPVNNDLQGKIFLYYCHTCGTYKNVYSQRGHKNGECKFSNVIFCELCGLGFSAENYKAHSTLHMKREITLNDYKLKNLFTGLEMELPIPNFYRCKNCKLHFLTQERCALHNCVDPEYDFCHICNKKFEVTAYKLHSNFHTYNDIPELMKKYNSINNMWNVVYECGYCNLASVTYDSAVEHSQNHVNNLPRPLSRSCQKCEFDILGEHYKLHMYHHDNDSNIDRSKFKILKYYYEHLYSKEWMSMFDTLPKSHKYQILSRSVYRITRCFKINCDANGVSDDYKLYCMKCKKNVLIEEMTKHYVDKKCEPSSKFVCKTCHLQFNTLNECVSHEKNHDKTLKSYKIITYNDKKYEQFDERLKEFELSPVKIPIKIPTPNKIIKPTMQKSSRIKYPTKNTKIITKIANTKNKFRNYSNAVKEVIKTTNRLKLYKCALCESCVSLRCNVMKHKCCAFGKSRTKCCKICKQSFYNRHYYIHLDLHRQFPRLKKPLVVLFNPKAKTLPVAVVFQCECGLHFTSKQTIDRHIAICNDENDDISRETCSKCNLIFPTDVLVSHLCKHHSKPMDIKVQLIKNENKKKGPFQCGKCYVVYSTMVDYDDHIFRCTSHQKNCDQCTFCNFMIDRKTFSDHKCDLNKKMIVIQKSVAICTMFKCNECNICYLSRKSIDYHFVVQHKNHRETITCEICKLNFTTQTYKNHLFIHSDEENFMINVKDAETGSSTITKGRNNIAPPKMPKTAEKATAEKPLKTPKVFLKKPAKLVVDEFPKTLYRCSVCKFCFSYQKRLEVHMSIGSHTGSSKCDICGLFISKRRMPRHQLSHENDPEYIFEVIEPETGITQIVRGKNGSGNNFNKGNADRKYGSPRVKRIKIENETLNIKNETLSNENDKSDNDFESVNMNDTETDFDNESVDNSSIGIDPLNCLELTMDETDCSVVKNTPKKYVIKSLTNKGMSVLDSKLSSYTSTLYKCKICDVHFLTESACYWHLRLGHKKPLQSHKCEKCHFNFSFVTIARHEYIHHKKMRLRSAKSFTVLDFDYDTLPSKSSTKGNKKDFDYDTMPSKSSIQVNKKAPITYLSKRANKIAPVNLVTNESVDKTASITPVSLTDAVEVETDNPIAIDDVVADTLPEAEKIQKNTKIHYYKCVDCNVCFVNEKTCRIHIAKHVLLDSKTYIECKICNFQFMISSLKHHISTQHKSEFDLEDLMITEFKASEDSNPKVDTYRGIDYVQSKLVSTTSDVAGNCDSNTVRNSTS